MPYAVLDPAGYSFSPFALPTFSVAMAMLLLGGYVLFRERASWVSASFFGICLAVSIWLLTFSLVYSAATPEVARWWSKTGYLGIPFIPATIYHFTSTVLSPHERRRPPLVWAIWLVSFAFAALTISTDMLIAETRRYWWGYHPIYDWLGVPFLTFFFGVLLLSLYDYWREYAKSAPGTHRTRVRSFLLAFSIGYLGATDFLPNFGIPVYPFGYLPVFVFLLIAARTIQRHRLVDLTPSFAANQIVGTIADPLVVCDAEGRIGVVNAATCAVFGYQERDLLGQPVECLVDNTPGELERLRNSLRLETVREEEMLFRTKLGAPVDVSVSISQLPSRTDQPVGAVLIARDIRERKRAEEERAHLIHEQIARVEAEAAQRRFAFLAEASNRLAGSLDYDAILTSVARVTVPTLATWCIVTLHDAGGAHRVEVAHANSAKEPTLRSLIERYPAQIDGDGHPVIPGVSMSQPTAAEVLPLVATALEGALAYDADHRDRLRELGVGSALVLPLEVDSRAVGTLLLVTSEPGYRYTPTDLALAQDLGRRLALAIYTARLYQQVQDAVHIRDEFLSAVSHDLKGPLTTIRGFAQLAQRQVARVDAPESAQIARWLDNILTGTNKMQALISELLDVARLQSNRPLDLERCPTDLVALTRQMAEEHQMVSKRHRLTVAAEATELIGIWDTFRLERVVDNLLSNAIKYSPDGGEIRLTVGQDATDQGAWAVLSVQDRGLGIPASDLPHVFERFHRAGNVVGRIRGTGIGLAGVKQIVEQHGGSIAVSSEEGAGSTFTVRLPLKSFVSATAVDGAAG